MPKVSIDHDTQMTAADAFNKIKTFFESDQDIRRFDSNLKCEFTDANMTGKAHGSQFKADISVTAKGSGSSVKVVVDLPLLLAPFKGKVQETIQRKLGKYLA